MARFKQLNIQLQELITEHGAAAVALAVADLSTCRCMKCGKTWRPRAAGIPAQCPACKNINWQTAKGA